MTSVARIMSQRIGIFVDVQNMFYSAKLLHQSKVDYGKLLNEVTGNRQLVRAIAYIIQKPDVDQSGFHEALSRIGYEIKVKELKVHNNEGRNNARGSWDVGMAVDILSMADKLDTVVLVTGDGDYTDLLDALSARGVRTEIVSFERSTANELIKAADQYIPIHSDWIFKEKKFENESSNTDEVYEGLPDDEELDAESRELEKQQRLGVLA